jgi:hypothetical protein
MINKNVLTGRLASVALTISITAALYDVYWFLIDF